MSRPMAALPSSLFTREQSQSWPWSLWCVRRGLLLSGCPSEDFLTHWFLGREFGKGKRRWLVFPRACTYPPLRPPACTLSKNPGPFTATPLLGAEFPRRVDSFVVSVAELVRNQDHPSPCPCFALGHLSLGLICLQVLCSFLASGRFALCSCIF